MTDPSAIKLGLKSIAEGILPFLMAASAVGVVAMAFIQTLKDMFPLRAWFQRRAVAKWLGTSAGNPGRSPEAAETDLVHLATDGDGNAFYGLPIEQLCGQINATLQVVLGYPSRHSELLHCLASGANPDDVNLLISASSQPERVITPADQLTPQQRIDLTQLSDARNRVGQQAQRSVDGLQISVGSRWEYWLKLASIILSVGLAILALFLVNEGDITQKLVGGTLAGVLGGFLAPVSRDLIAALEQLRQ
jgi:hypothetical protein